MAGVYKSNPKAKTKTKIKTTRLKVKLPVLTNPDWLRKFGKARSERAISYAEGEFGVKKLTTAKQYQFAGDIAKKSKEMGTKLNLNKANKIARRTKKMGMEPSYRAASRKKK